MTGTPFRRRLANSPTRQLAKVVGLILGIVAVMFVIGYFVAVRVLFPPLPEPENGIAVPKLTGLTVASAQSQLNGLDLRLTEVTEIPHQTEPEGIIVAQSPLPGQQLRTAGAVRVAVSSGLPRVNVPNVVGMTLERALALLASLSLDADQQPEHSMRPAGTVVRVSPPPGTEFTIPARVRLYISAGPPPTDSLPPAQSESLLPSPDTLPLD